MLALAMDIGRPDRFWHPLVYWNVHSVLWEITWCVILYSIVLVLEFLPILFENKYLDRWPKLRDYGELIHKASPVFAAIGLVLSLLHQSSLGATYGVLSGRAIWYKPSLPVMFILSAVAGGIAMTLLLTILVGKIEQKADHQPRTAVDISRFAGYALLAYLVSSRSGTGRLHPITAIPLAQPKPWHCCNPQPLTPEHSGGSRSFWEVWFQPSFC